jgi:hypothetical protein
MAGETIISIAYGLDVLSKNDPYITTAEAGVHPLVIAAVPGAFLVDVIPVLKHIPEWFPFAGFKRKAKEWRKLARMMVDVPYEAAKREIVRYFVLSLPMLVLMSPSQSTGDITPSFTSYSLEGLDDSRDLAYQESIVKSTAGTMFAGKLSLIR